MTRTRAERGAPTIRDVATAAGVSNATAARALGGYGAVSEEARRRIDDAAAALGYRTNSLARSMITGATNTLGLIIADIENPFFARATRGFTDAAREEGFEVVVTNTDEDVDTERTAVRLFMEKQVDGLVVAPATQAMTEHLQAALDAGTPVVLLDRRVPGLAADSVLVDNRKASEAAVAHLTQHGHRRIAIVTGASLAELEAGAARSGRHLLSTGKNRIDGYLAALRRAGITPQDEYIKVGDFHRDAAGGMTRELLALPIPPTAIFTTDGIISLGVVEALQEHGLAMPEQMSVVGFDDPEWALVVRPRLTVVAQPVYELGRRAAQRLIARIRGDVARPRRHHLPTELIVRDSVTHWSG
ncbi:LacI family transcriptional regulator (plasmid) [Embleya sp. NBC_00888]|uniref:LacI family DNA-binding transcriptional regulator n=1 Tax=Embleya sp. NBC_00888 TaxID=2975960 RepID=UPI00386BF168|nr:LacI family transcriptional regulator [Embleya sp. NBC_00888]